MFSQKIHRYIFLFGVFSFAFGMMVGTVPTSVPQLILAGNWLLEGDFKRKWDQLRTNTVFWILASVFFIHAIGLLYTQNFSAGIDDVRTKLPLVFLPLIFFTARPFSRKEFHGILYCFIAGCVANTAWCIFYSFVLHKSEVVRDASRFMSHIRLGLYLNIAIAACIYFLTQQAAALKKAGFAVLAVYFVCVLYLLGLASGLANFVLLVLLTLCVVIYRQKPVIKLAGLIAVVGFLALVANYVASVYTAQVEVKHSANNQTQSFSPSGRPYLHFEVNGQKENGNFVQINVQPEELYKGWKKEFPEDSFNYEAKHNLQRFEVLVRYLASRGLNKDSAGLAQLSASDKENIRKGIPNYEFVSWSNLHKRTYELVNEYDEFGGNRFVNGHSITMRLYFWKAGLQLAGRHWLFGVGTGDVQQELNAIYEETDSPLDPEWYKRPHNQFITIMVAVGLIGLLIFMCSLIYPLLKLRPQLPVLYWPFFVIVVLSFFLEDTLETQAGCTFYAFFNALFLSRALHETNASNAATLE